MNEYFPREQSIGARMGTAVKPVLKTIASRFVSDNPPVPAVYWLRSREEFAVTEDYMDKILLHDKIEGMEYEDYAYAWAVFTPPAAGEFHFRFQAYGPVAIFVNGELQFRTNHVQERFFDQVSDVVLRLREGANSLFFQCIATPLGCGFCIGSSSYKGRRIQFFSPLRERKGISGFLWAGPFQKGAMDQIGRIPSPEESGEETGICWLPRVQWSGEERQASLSRRLFGRDGAGMIAAAAFSFPHAGSCRVETERGTITRVWMDGREVPLDAGGEGAVEFSAPSGRHVLALLGTELEPAVFLKGTGALAPACPVLTACPQVSWIYAGPVAQGEEPAMASILTFQKPVVLKEKTTFWQADLPGMYLRPFNEGVLYGEWNYPLGVTLYGMIQSARVLGDEAMAAYVEGHMRKCVGFYDYCMWDKETYGAAPFHNQLTTIDSLDDCGSFASALLETMKDREVPEGRRIGRMVAEYMKTRQQRMPDGTFYRNHSYLPVMNETMWADDMYMSVPFLCRYYQAEGDEAALEDAARQVKQMFSYLYMPDLQIMSHIYDARYQVQTRVPWGRGNGWVLFSLTELLAVLPERHKDREEILGIFRKLCQGYLRLQDERGMWHQVLTFPDSYLETSCTAMFVYGFARGVRYGWLEERDVYRESARRGWEALCDIAVDWKGNIYGVCRGSGYSFSKEYYARDLGWNFNDTHGTGIVLLAGIEVEKMNGEREEA